MPVINRIADFHADMTAWRHDIHQHPELAYKENRTAAKVAGLLRDFGLSDVQEGIGQTGVVGLLENGDGPMIGLRADMDALPIEELSSLPYKSVHHGVMHACGHDGHTAMLLGAARHLSETRNFKGKIAFIFQPAEEGAAGAKAMVDDGLFQDYPVEQVFGVHNMPGLPSGTVAISPGPVMAAADKFTLSITGHGGHAAFPETVRDPVVASSALIQALQTIVSRNVSPLDTLVISVTRMEAGDAFNVVPETATLHGTCRYFREAIGDLLHKRIKQVIDGVSLAYDVSVDLTYQPGYPPTVNAPEPAAFLESVATNLFGADKVVEQAPVMGAEDFSYFLNEKPGAYAFIGNGGQPGGGCVGLHNPTYDFNDEILPVGASLFTRLAETALPAA